MNRVCHLPMERDLLPYLSYGPKKPFATAAVAQIAAAYFGLISPLALAITFVPVTLVGGFALICIYDLAIHTLIQMSRRSNEYYSEEIKKQLMGAHPDQLPTKDQIDKLKNDAGLADTPCDVILQFGDFQVECHSQILLQCGFYKEMVALFSDSKNPRLENGPIPLIGLPKSMCYPLLSYLYTKKLEDSFLFLEFLNACARLEINLEPLFKGDMINEENAPYWLSATELVENRTLYESYNRGVKQRILDLNLQGDKWRNIHDINQSLGFYIEETRWFQGIIKTTHKFSGENSRAVLLLSRLKFEKLNLPTWVYSGADPCTDTFIGSPAYVYPTEYWAVTYTGQEVKIAYNGKYL